MSSRVSLSENTRITLGLLILLFSGVAFVFSFGAKAVKNERDISEIKENSRQRDREINAKLEVILEQTTQTKTKVEMILREHK
jgi:hypothetical protein